MSGSFVATFMVVFRESLEASLILGIILTVLSRLCARRYFSSVFLSAGVAVGLSIALGLFLSGLAESTKDKAQEILEGVISLLAAGVLTYMFFWMEKQARVIKSDIECKVERALSAKDSAAIMSLSFFAVLREGAETVLFLKAVALQSESGSASWWGAAAGMGVALFLALCLFVGGRKVPLKPLFRVTGVFILFMAAGLLAYGIHELEEAGWIVPIIYPVWNINSILNEKEGAGSFLKALFGYNGNPSLTEVLAYWTYLVTIFFVIKKSKTGKNV